MPIAHMVSGVTYGCHDIEGHVREALRTNIEALYRFLSVSHCIYTIFPLPEQRVINLRINPFDWIEDLPGCSGALRASCRPILGRVPPRRMGRQQPKQHPGSPQHNFSFAFIYSRTSKQRCLSMMLWFIIEHGSGY